MSKVWEIMPQKFENLVDQLLFNRGIKTKKEKKQFFNPQLSDYKKDLDLSGIDKATRRVLGAVKNQELIVVYGDYDVDGVCGAAVLYFGLTSLGAKVLPFIPHREKDGYGLSKEGVQEAKEKGAKLIITVDNGIVAIEAAKFAKKLGLDLIITDHHQPLDKKPEALSIIHSTQLSGTAVAWCLVRALVSEDQAVDLLDLVAMATICDLIPLIEVSRALVKIGLEKLNQTKRVGLLALISLSGLELGSITSYQVGHMLGPRLNAIGRLEHALDALRLLCTKEPGKAQRLARLLDETNNQKKQLTLEAIFEAQQEVGEKIDKKILVLHSPKWIPGIIGLVAARITEEYRLPAIIISKGELESKGSARSSGGLDIITTLRKLADILVDVGGHRGAAGFTIKTSQIENFKQRLEEVMEAEILDGEDKLNIEVLIKPEKLNKELVKQLDQFEPTGMGNPKPILASKNVKLSNLKTVGDGKHLKGLSEGVDFIAFGMGEKLNQLLDPAVTGVDLAYYLEIDRFNGSEKLQLKILDIK